MYHVALFLQAWLLALVQFMLSSVTDQHSSMVDPARDLFSAKQWSQDPLEFMVSGAHFLPGLHFSSALSQLSDVNNGCHIDHIFTRTTLWPIFFCLCIAWSYITKLHYTIYGTWHTALVVCTCQLDSLLCLLQKFSKMVGCTIPHYQGRHSVFIM